MLRITVKRIPRSAQYCYLLGFFLIGVAMIIYRFFPSLLQVVRLQQLFIGGAIVVAVGSVLNLLFQLRQDSSTNGEES